MKVRINLASAAELTSLPGIGPEQAAAIVTWRVEHGPIHNEDQLHKVLAAWPLPKGIGDRLDFEPAEGTAPEAPGA